MQLCPAPHLPHVESPPQSTPDSRPSLAPVLQLLCGGRGAWEGREVNVHASSLRHVAVTLVT